MKKILLLIILMFVGIINTKAISLKRKDLDDIYFVQNGLPDYYMSGRQFYLSFDDVTAYCLEPKLKILGYDYTLKNINDLSYSDEAKDYLSKVIYFGYDYPGHQDIKYYMATQALIWEYVSDFVVQYFTEQYGYGNQISVTNERNEILSLIENYEKLPMIANKEENYDYIKELKYVDSLFSNYDLVQSNYSDITFNNSELKINNLGNYVGRINLKFKRKNYRNDTTKIYVRDGSQTMMSGGKLLDKEFTFTINIKGYNVEINKLDSQSNQNIINSNVVINMKNIETNNYVYINGSKDLKINNDGKLNLNNIPYGTYEIKEISTNNEYKLNTNSIKILIDKDTKINLYNEKEKGSINLTKYVENYDYENSLYENKLGDNIEFNLYALEDVVTRDNVIHYKKDDLVDSCITVDGMCKFDDLVLGKYYVKEKVPSSYIDNNKIYEFDLRDNKEQSIEINNELKKNNLIINKKDIDSKLLINDSNVIVNIKDINGNYIYINGNKDLTISKDGTLIINDIPENIYYIKEVSTNNEYKLNEEIIKVELDKDIEINLYNEKEKGSINLTKYVENYDYENSLYEYKLGDNIEFNLYALEDVVTRDNVIHYKKDDLVDSCITVDGMCKFDDLVLGKYYVKEKVPSSYIDNNKIYEFNLRENKEQSIEINNELKKNNLIIKKVDSLTKIPLSNVTFEIYFDGNSIGIFKTDSNGEIKINDIPLGIYEIEEKETLDGYVLDSDKKIIDLEKTNILEIENSKKIIIPNALSNKDDKFKYILSSIIGIVILLCLKYLK